MSPRLVILKQMDRTLTYGTSLKSRPVMSRPTQAELAELSWICRWSMGLAVDYLTASAVLVVDVEGLEVGAEPKAGLTAHWAAAKRFGEWKPHPERR